jgi:hypothetical protein
MIVSAFVSRVHRLLFCVGIVAVGLAHAAPYPSTLLVRHGFAGSEPNDTCCQSLLVGWGPNATPVVLSSGWIDDEQAIRYSVELHDLVFDLPVELYSLRIFQGDDSLPGGCRDSTNLLRCVWTGHSAEIQRALARAKVKLVGPVPLLALPPFTVQWMTDSVPQSGSAPFAFDDSAGHLQFRMPDTSSPGLHLLPVGVLKTRTPHGRLLVLRLARRDHWDEPMQDVGVRFARLPDAKPAGGSRKPRPVQHKK